MMLSETAIVVQARMESVRLPGKVLRELNGKPMIFSLFNRLLTLPVHIVVAAISRARASDPLYWELIRQYYNVYRGDPANVFKRMCGAIEGLSVETLVRVTADNPLTDLDAIRAGVRKLRLENLDYLWMSHLPVGMGCDIFNVHTFRRLAEEPLTPEEQEHIVYAFRNRDLKGAALECPYPEAAENLSYTVDTEADFENIKKVFEQYDDGFKPVDNQQIIQDALK